MDESNTSKTPVFNIENHLQIFWMYFWFPETLRVYPTAELGFKKLGMAKLWIASSLLALIFFGLYFWLIPKSWNRYEIPLVLLGVLIANLVKTFLMYFSWKIFIKPHV